MGSFRAESMEQTSMSNIFEAIGDCFRKLFRHSTHLLREELQLFYKKIVYMPDVHIILLIPYNYNSMQWSWGQNLSIVNILSVAEIKIRGLKFHKN